MAQTYDDADLPVPSHFPAPGPQRDMRCPKCGATDITCLDTMIEFSKLHCSACGFDEIVDRYQISNWFDVPK